MKNKFKMIAAPLAFGLALVVSGSLMAQVKQRPANAELYRYSQNVSQDAGAAAPIASTTSATRHRTETRTRMVPVTRPNGATENVAQTYTVTVPYTVTAAVSQQPVIAPNFSSSPTWNLMVDGWVDFEGFNIDRLHQGSPLLGFFDGFGRQCFLEPGDVISHVNGQKIYSINQFLGLVRNAPNPRQIHLQVINWRNGEVLNLVIAAKKAS